MCVRTCIRRYIRVRTCGRVCVSACGTHVRRPTHVRTRVRSCEGAHLLVCVCVCMCMGLCALAGAGARTCALCEGACESAHVPVCA